MAKGNDNFKINKLGGANLPFYVDGSDALANKKQIITFYHVNSDHFVAFKAFITAYNETYNSDWASEKVYGRADPIYMFKNTTRKITLAFRIPAATVDEAYQNLSRLQKLIQYLYPNYTGLRPRAYDHTTQTWEEERNSATNTPRPAHANTISGAPLVRMGMMNLARRRSSADVDKFVATEEDPTGKIESSVSADANTGLLGVIENINVNHNIEGDDGIFEMNMQGAILPKMIEVNIDFSPIHEQHLGWFDDGTFGDVAFPYGAVDDMSYYETSTPSSNPGSTDNGEGSDAANATGAGTDTDADPDARMPDGTENANDANDPASESQTSEAGEAAAFVITADQAGSAEKAALANQVLEATRKSDNFTFTEGWGDYTMNATTGDITWTKHGGGTAKVGSQNWKDILSARVVADELAAFHNE